ncbi:MAG: hypothetical protein LBU06_05755 [Desulfovibrio sp.]|jgi:hypothetical protein|nr:hypothetical protein [Desulfovibrio sp.]
MLIDQLCVFFDNTTVTANAQSPGLPLPIYAGRFDARGIAVLIKGANAADFLVKAQESDDDATYADVASCNISKPANAAVLAAIEIPARTRKKRLRLSYTATGAAIGDGEGGTTTGPITGLSIFAGFTRDAPEPYAPGQYVNSGRTVA